MSGLEAARHISDFEHPPAVVFTTAYEKHALEAFNVHAAGFLTKPVQLDQFTEVLANLQHQTLRKITEPAIFGDIERHYICHRLRSGINLIALNRVTYIQSSNKCTIVHHLRGRSITEQSLKSFEEQFGERLLRIHRNALVNKAYVSSLECSEDGTYLITLRHEEDKLEVSRRSLPGIRKYLQTFMEPKLAIRRRERFLARYRGQKKINGVKPV